MNTEQKQCMVIISSFVVVCGIALGSSLYFRSSSAKSLATPTTSSQASTQPVSVSNGSLEMTSSPSTIPISATIQNNSSTLSCAFSVSNTWTENGKIYSQLAGKLTNTGDTTISNWQVDLLLPKNTTISQSWNGTYTIKDDKLTILPVDYNKEIPASTSIEIGCILNSETQIDTSHISCTADGVQVASTTPMPTLVPDTNTNATSISSEPIVLTEAEKAKIAKEGDWLYTKGNQIIDKNGKQVWLTGLNWFGYNTGTNTFDGLWNANLDQCIKSIADHGFNLLRIPISAELINNWSKGTYPTANFNQAQNSHLVNKNSQEIFDYMLGLCKTNGIKVMLDIHSAETDASGHMVNVWYTAKVSEADYLAALSYMAKRYATDDTIIAYDLKNEPHGKPNETPHAIWNNSTSPNNWKYIAEKAASAVLKQNPNALIMVEGIEIYPRDIKSNGDYHSTNSSDYYFNWWGGNLRGVKDYPINLGEYQNKLVYSPHDYGPAVYAQPWFKSGYTYNSLYTDCWHDNWFYIYEEKTAPLLIGEWGGYMTEPNLTWMTHMKRLISKFKLHHTFWCYNANSGDTGGLVLDDFTTWDEQKYSFVKDVLWQKDGKFVGLDQETPLGTNGISLQEYSK